MKSVHTEILPCKYCGRCVLVGWCCDARKDVWNYASMACGLRLELLHVLKVARPHMTPEQVKSADAIIRKSHQL